MAFCVFIGLLAGRFLDNIFGISPVLTIVFAFMGALAAIKVIYDITKDWK